LILTKALNNWKLRLILSALLCIMGLAAMISMVLGVFVDLSVYDKSLVAIAIFMVGIPAYLIISGLAKIDELTIAEFLNQQVDELRNRAELLAQNEEILNEKEKEIRSELMQFIDEHPIETLLPDKPVKQAYFLMLASIIISFGIWFAGA
jgi:type III secretory pathway component EscR